MRPRPPHPHVHAAVARRPVRALRRAAILAVAALLVPGACAAPFRAARSRDAWGARPAVGDTIGPPRLHVEERGEGPTVVFLHGLAGSAGYFREHVAPVAEDHHVVLVDLLGFGRSPKPDTRYDVERHVAELRRVLRGRGRLTIVGHSLGARIALAYAARFPADVDRLVLISLPYFPQPGGAIAYARHGGWRRSMWTDRRVAATGFFALRTLPTPLVERFAPHVPREVLRESRDFTTRSATSSLYDAVFGYDPVPDIERVPVHVSVTLVHGERDTTTPIDGVLDALGRRPDWRLVIVGGADHHPMLRVPRAIAALLAERPPLAAAAAGTVARRSAR